MNRTGKSIKDMFYNRTPNSHFSKYEYHTAEGRYQLMKLHLFFLLSSLIKGINK